jgi:hypothetical protein
MNYVLLLTVLFCVGFRIRRIYDEAQSYRLAWGISWKTSLRYHVEWDRHIARTIGTAVAIIVIYALVWGTVNYGCLFLKGVAC